METLLDTVVKISFLFFFKYRLFSLIGLKETHEFSEFKTKVILFSQNT